MKKSTKLCTAAVMVSMLVASWLFGVAMGYSTANRNASAQISVQNVVILKHLESGEPDKAANWCKGFIVGSHRVQTFEPSWIVCLRAYFESPKDPHFSKSISEKIDEVVKNDSPNIIDVNDPRNKHYDPNTKIIIEDR